MRKFAVIDGVGYWICDGCGKLLVGFDISGHHCITMIDWPAVQKHLWDKLHASVDGPARGWRVRA